MFHQNVQHFFIFLWQFVYQEMDSINTRFWASTFFKKKKKKTDYSESNTVPEITDDNSSSVQHLSTENLNVFATFPKKGGGGYLFQCECNECLSLGWYLRTEDDYSFSFLHSTLQVCSSLEGDGHWVTAPQWNANKIGANRFFPLRVEFYPPKRYTAVLTP